MTSTTMDMEKTPSKVDTNSVDDEVSGTTTIFIEPTKEAAALRRFDKFFVPAAYVFLVLSALDRSNVRNLLQSSLLH